MYAMPGWGDPLEPMKQADIPVGDIPESFDWRSKGEVYSIEKGSFVIYSLFFLS